MVMRNAFIRRVCRLSLVLALVVGSAAARAAETRSIGALGRIQPAGGVVDLGAPGPEPVAAVRVAAGDTVEAGQALIEFGGREAAQAELQLARLELREAEQNGPNSLRTRELALIQARADLALATERLERYLKLNGSSISAQETALRQHQVTTATTQVETAALAHESARITVETSIESARLKVAQAERRLAGTTLTAPIAATILEVNAVVGGRAGPTVVKLADTSRMIVLAEVFEAELGRLRVGAPCEVKHDALGREPVAGKLVRVGRLVTASSKVVQVWIELARTEPADRYIGMEVNVTIQP